MRNNLQHPDITATERTGYPRRMELFALCDECCDPIYIGDEYYEIRGYQFCSWCVENMKKEAEE